MCLGTQLLLSTLHSSEHFTASVPGGTELAKLDCTFYIILYMSDPAPWLSNATVLSDNTEASEKHLLQQLVFSALMCPDYTNLSGY